MNFHPHLSYTLKPKIQLTNMGSLLHLTTGICYLQLLCHCTCGQVAGCRLCW